MASPTIPLPAVREQLSSLRQAAFELRHHATRMQTNWGMTGVATQLRATADDLDRAREALETAIGGFEQ